MFLIHGPGRRISFDEVQSLVKQNTLHLLDEWWIRHICNRLSKWQLVCYWSYDSKSTRRTGYFQGSMTCTLHLLTSNNINTDFCSDNAEKLLNILVLCRLNWDNV